MDALSRDVAGTRRNLQHIEQSHIKGNVRACLTIGFFELMLLGMKSMLKMCVATVGGLVRNLWVAGMSEEETQKKERVDSSIPHLETELFIVKHLGPNYLRFLIQRAAQHEENWHSLAKEILKYFECKRCGHCCRRIPVELDDEEVARLCKVLKINFEEFEREYLDPTANGVYLKLPCPFLKENLCTIYECRPETCRFYPFRPDDSIASCPMGLEIIDKIVASKVTKIVIPRNIPEDIRKKLPPEIVIQEEDAPQEFLISMKATQKYVQRKIAEKRPVISQSEIGIPVLFLPIGVLWSFLEKLREEKVGGAIR